MVLEATITIECFLVVWPLQSMVFQWFLVLLPSLSMVFDGFGPLVKRCDGFDGSSWSTSDSCTSVEWWIVWIRTKWQWQRDKKGSCQIPNNEILSPWKSVLSCLVNSSLVSEFSMRRSASGHFCFISPSISLSQDFPPWPMLKLAIWK